MSRERYQISVRRHRGSKYFDQESFSVYADDINQDDVTATSLAILLRDKIKKALKLAETPELYTDRKGRRERERAEEDKRHTE